MCCWVVFVHCLSSGQLLTITQVSSRFLLCLFLVRCPPTWHGTGRLFHPTPLHPTPNRNSCIGFYSGPRNQFGLNHCHVLCVTKFVLWSRLSCSWLSILLMLAYMGTVIVILLNILIAQMSTTYTQAKRVARLEYDVDRILLLTRMERFSLLVCKRHGMDGVERVCARAWSRPRVYVTSVEVLPRACAWQWV